MTYFAVHDLGLDFDTALYGESAARLMLMLNQHGIVNCGEENMMTLSDIEESEKLEKLRNGTRQGTIED